MKKIKMKTIKIVDKIRRQTEGYLNNDLFGSTQPNIKRQLKIINNLLDQNICIEVVKAPAFLITENEKLIKDDLYWKTTKDKNEVLLIKSFRIDEKYDFNMGNDKCLFILAWSKLPDVPVVGEIIRFASYPKIVYTPFKV